MMFKGCSIIFCNTFIYFSSFSKDFKIVVFFQNGVKGVFIKHRKYECVHGVVLLGGIIGGVFFEGELEPAVGMLV